MKSTKNTRAVTVGIFIFLAIVIFVVGVLTLGGQHNTFAETITVRAFFDDVSGLQKGNNIWLSGVKVGTVQEVRFGNNELVEVVMNIDEDAQQYVHKNTKAKIGSDGLIGNRIVVLYDGSAQAPVVKEGDVLAVEKSVSTEEMMQTFQASNENLQDITTDFKTISKRLAEGQGTLGKLLTDESTMNEIQATLAVLNRAAVNARIMTNNLTDYTRKFQTEGSLANELVTDTVLFSRLKATATQLNEVAAEANTVTSNLRSATSNLTNSLSNPNTPAGLLLNDAQTAARLKQTIQNLQTSTRKLDENMEALQSNFLFRGFFRRRAREQEKNEARQQDSTTSVQNIQQESNN